MDKIWTELEIFMQEQEARFDLSFSLQYTSVIDWVAGLTPRKNHPQARQYDVWQGQASNPVEAIRRVLELARSQIKAMDDTSEPQP